jgi:SAM-dependent methyltransferase
MIPITSFRDPGGFCFVCDHRLFRAVSPQAIAGIAPFLSSDMAKTLVASRDLVSSRTLDPSEQDALLRHDDFRLLAHGRLVGAVLEHERIEFASYPYEWAPDMLHAAGLLTLNLAQSCLNDGFSLKDASPYNVLFRGSAPIFIDVLSFERRNPGDPLWKPYAQFCRTFLLPLLANKAWGVRLADIFGTRRDGLEPAEVYRLCGPLQKLRPPFLTLVSMPTWLSRKATGNAIYRDRFLADPQKARFILESSFRRLRRVLQSLRPRDAGTSIWSHYEESHSYANAALEAKEEFLRNLLRDIRPKRVLDVGANTGRFSAIAARAKAEVVAIDSDAACVGALWQRAQSEELNILPLVVDLARPSAGSGWRNRECAGFLGRASRAFDVVLMLGVLHHLLITERVPLKEILDLAAELTTRWLVIEFMGPEDKMFQILTRGRGQLYAGLTTATFEAACQGTFVLVRSQRVPGMDRWLYILEKSS